MVKTLGVVFHVVVGLELETLVLQLDASFQEPLHIFHCNLLVHLANQFLKWNPVAASEWLRKKIGATAFSLGCLQMIQTPGFFFEEAA